MRAKAAPLLPPTKRFSCLLGIVPNYDSLYILSRVLDLPFIPTEAKAVLSTFLTWRFSPYPLELSYRSWHSLCCVHTFYQQAFLILILFSHCTSVWWRSLLLICLHIFISTAFDLQILWLGNVIIQRERVNYVIVNMEIDLFWSNIRAICSLDLGVQLALNVFEVLKEEIEERCQ